MRLAALCADAETARGARVWNHANVLALSLRATSEPVAREILDAWFSTSYSDDEWNQQQMQRIRHLHIIWVKFPLTFVVWVLALPIASAYRLRNRTSDRRAAQSSLRKVEMQT